MEPYVIGLLPRYVEIRTISPRALIQSIELSKPRYITQGKHMYVASTSHVWRLIPVSIPMQIQQLLQDKQFSLALMLAVSKQCFLNYVLLLSQKLMFKPSSLHLECVTHPDVNNILLIFIQKIASKANFCLWKILKDIKRVFDWDLGHQNSLPGKCTLILYQFFQSNHFRVWTWFVLITLTCKQQKEMWSCVVTI